MKNEIKIALVGAGKIAWEHLKAFKDIEGVEIAGVFSRTINKAETLANEFSISKVCNSINDLYKSTGADLVIVTVNVESMLDVSLECFKYPWAVLLEKPAGCNFEEAELLFDKSVENNASVFVGFNRRFYSSTQSVISDLKSQKSARYIHVLDNQNTELAAKLGFHERTVKYWMYANSIHLIDYFRIMGRGEITSVVPVTKWNQANPSIVLSKLEYESGDTGLYEGIWKGPGRWAVDVTTAEKHFELKPLEESSFQNLNDRTVYKHEVSEQDKNFKPGFRLQAEEILKTVRGEESEAVTLADSLKTMKLINQIFGV